MITILPLHHHGSEWIGVQGTFNSEVHAAIKNISGRQYSKTHRCYYFPFKKEMIDIIISALSPVTAVDAKAFVNEHNAQSDTLKRVHFLVVPATYGELLTRMRYSGATIKNYLVQFRHFMEFIYPMPPENATRKQIELYMLALVRKRQVSVSTQNIAINAIKFYFEHVRKESREYYAVERPRTPFKLPVVLSEEEVVTLFKHNIILSIGAC